MQMADEVPEGSGADSRQGSGRFRCRWLMDEVLQCSGADVREESGADG